MDGDEDNYISESCDRAGVPDLRTDDWLSYYADIVAGAVQYGGRSALCDTLEPVKNAEPRAIADVIVAYGDADGTSPDQYDRTVVASTTIDPYSSGRPWGFQYCTEYGWY